MHPLGKEMEREEEKTVSRCCLWQIIVDNESAFSDGVSEKEACWLIQIQLEVTNYENKNFMISMGKL